MPTTDAFQNAIINHFLRNTTQTPPTTVYLSLSTTTPVEAGTNFTEPSGITRQAITLGSPSAGSSSNSGTISFTNSSGGSWVVTYIGIFTASTSGTLWMYKALTSSRTILNGETFSWSAGDILTTFT